MSRPDLDYYRHRLATERRHAETAAAIEARHVHRQLADRYGALIGEPPRLRPAS